MQEPLAADMACAAVGRMGQNRRRVFDIEAWLEDPSGRVHARATGRYVAVPAAHLERFRADFVTAPECLNLDHIFGGSPARKR